MPTTTNRLAGPADGAYDHILGPANAQITLVEYGSYACPHCRAANDRIAQIRDQFGDRMPYIFRHRPLTGSDIAQRAAELVEHADAPQQFWGAHIKLMTRSETLTEDDLAAVASDLGVSGGHDERAKRAAQRVAADVESSGESGVLITPTFFINSHRYDGPWDESSFADAILARFIQCAVQRHGLPVGANSTRQLSLQPVAIGAVVEVTKRLKPSVQRVLQGTWRVRRP